jgi:hypothetical protein
MVEYLCDECKEVLYSNIDGIIFSGDHKATCSRRSLKTQFALGMRVKRKKYYQDRFWDYGDDILTVSRISSDARELSFKELEDVWCNFWESSKFEPVKENG